MHIETTEMSQVVRGPTWRTKTINSWTVAPAFEHDGNHAVLDKPLCRPPGQCTKRPLQHSTSKDWRANLE